MPRPLASRRLARLSLAAFALAALALPAPAQAQAQQKPQEIRLSIEQAGNLADNALNAGRFDLALAITEALLARDPGDFRALIQSAIANIGLGRHEEAAKQARKAWRAAPDKAGKVQAARLAASANFRAGRHLRAELWLRRAFNLTRGEAERQLLRREFATVHAQNPLRIGFGFSAAPSNNVNNGSSSQTIIIWNLPFQLSPDARALSGIEYAANLSLNYRISGGKDHATRLGLSLYDRTYTLSAAAKAAAPSARGSDYAFAMAEATLTHDRRFAALPGPSSFGLTLGKFWYADKPYIDYGRLSFAQDIPLNDKQKITLQAGYEEQLSQRSHAKSWIGSAGIGYQGRLGADDKLSLSLLYSDTTSEDPTAASTAWRLQFGYTPARQIAGMNLDFGLSAEWRDYPFSVYSPDGRHDQSLSLQLRATFPKLSLYGFSPSLTLENGITRSNISLYQRRSSAIRLGIESTF